jgi:5-formyltetrahydrofolate cyclo-ligase
VSEHRSEERGRSGAIGGIVSEKDVLRATVKASRAAVPETDRERDRASIRAHVLQWLASSNVPAGCRIAAYEPLRTEPGSIELLADLHRAGYEVIVPITLADNDLDWAVWTLTRQARQPLGVDAISQAALVIVPAFAVDPAGRRLGRGGGSYDRALARIAPEVPAVALLFPDELVDSVPVDDWDRPVSAVVTPAAWIGLGNT